MKETYDEPYTNKIMQFIHSYNYDIIRKHFILENFNIKYINLRRVLGINAEHNRK